MLISEQGYPADSSLLAGYSKRYSPDVFMANFVGPSGGWRTAGQSAIWSDGQLVAAASATDQEVLIAELGPDGWFCQTVKF